MPRKRLHAHRLRTAPGGRVTNSVDRIDRGQADRRNGGEQYACTPDRFL